MEIPGIGEFEKDEDLGWYFGPRMAIPVLGGEECCLVLDGYDGDERPEEFHAAATNFLSIGEDVLKQATPFVFAYYQDCVAARGAPATIAKPADVWRHVEFGDELQIARRAYGDKGVYVAVSCECDWEDEHGLQLVFKNGQVVNKVGAYDGHLTNSDAFADPGYEDVVYVDREEVKRRIAARNKRKPVKPQKAKKVVKAQKTKKPQKAKKAAIAKSSKKPTKSKQAKSSKKPTKSKQAKSSKKPTKSKQAKSSKKSKR